MDGNGWDAYRLHITTSLDRLGKSLDGLDNKVDDLKLQSAKDLSELKMEVSNLKMRSGFWGAVTGALAAIGASFSFKLFGH